MTRLQAQYTANEFMELDEGNDMSATFESILDKARTDRRDLINMPRLKQAISDNELDAVIAVSPVNVTYTGGINWSDREQSWGFVVTSADGRQGSVINEADAYHMREYSWLTDVRSSAYAKTKASTHQQAIDLLVGLLEDMGLVSSKIGLELSHMSVNNFRRLEKALPNARFSDGNAVFEHARLVKTPAEVDLFRVAAFYTDKAMATAFALARPGDTEKRLSALMQSLVLQLGADLLTTNTEITAGVHGTTVHCWPIERPIAPGEIVHTDFGGNFAGYRTDMARNAVVIEATSAQESIYRRLWEVQHRIFDQMKPGTVVGELFELGKRSMEEVGLPHPWGTFGHSTGLYTHEGFDISAGSEAVLEPGMLVNVEPSRVEPGDGRYTIEDTVLITETGYERLSSFTDTQNMLVIS